MIFLLIGIGVFISFYLMVIYAEYIDYAADTDYTFPYKKRTLRINGPTLPRFTFKQFLRFYNLNSNAWEIYYVNGDWNSLPARLQNNQYYPIFFTNAFEYWKYTRWAKKMASQSEGQNNNQKQYENTKKIISFIQEDINKIQIDYKNNLSNTENTLTTALENLKKERTIE